MAAPSVFLVGSGAAATALAMALSRAGVSVLGIHGRSARKVREAASRARVEASAGRFPAALGLADVVWIAVSDDAIRSVATSLARSGILGRRQIVLHASGVWGREVLVPLAPAVRATGSLHPLQSLAEPALAAASLRGATFAVEGDAIARRAGAAIARALGGRPVTIPTRSKALYHAAASMTSNGTVGVVAAAVDALVASGLPRSRALRILVPLLEGTVGNLTTLGLPSALTGPVARGDRKTIAAHRAALSHVSGLLPLYDALVRAQRRIST
ncbi:MAG: DUF2520 domain-containing protein [Deltaproteobacteria bacterium]|nr:DUF2520 domain-containing protein [Deltaproteobacteria bacterium]